MRVIEWETPQPFFDYWNGLFRFDLDVCALPSNAKCPRYFTPDDDALKQTWTGVCWMNPPYGRDVGLWVRKAYESSLQGATVVCLLPNRTETDWFHQYCLKGDIRWVHRRIHFVGGGRPRFGSMVVIFRPPAPKEELQCQQAH